MSDLHAYDQHPEREFLDAIAPGIVIRVQDLPGEQCSVLLRVDEVTGQGFYYSVHNGEKFIRTNRSWDFFTGRKWRLATTEDEAEWILQQLGEA